MCVFASISCKDEPVRITEWIASPSGNRLLILLDRSVVFSVAIFIVSFLHCVYLSLLQPVLQHLTSEMYPHAYALSHTIEEKIRGVTYNARLPGCVFYFASNWLNRNVFSNMAPEESLFV